MAHLQLEGFIIRRGHRVVFIRSTRRVRDRRRAVKKRRKPQPRRRQV